MVQIFFERSCTIDRLRRGPLAGHIDLVVARLATDGYSRVHSWIQLRLVGHFNRWLDQNSLTAEQLDEDASEFVLKMYAHCSDYSIPCGSKASHPGVRIGQ